MNSYNYCQNNPVNRVDLDGMSDIDPPKKKESQNELKDHQGYKAFSQTNYGQKYIKLFETVGMKNHDLIFKYNNTTGAQSYFGFYNKDGERTPISKLKPSDINNIKLYFVVSVAKGDRDDGKGVIAETIGHEMFLHNSSRALDAMTILNGSDSAAQKVKDLQMLNGDININGYKTTFGQREHAELSVGQNSAYNSYMKQLKEVLSSNEYDKAINETIASVDLYLNKQTEYTRTLIHQYLDSKYNVKKLSNKYLNKLNSMKK